MRLSTGVLLLAAAAACGDEDVSPAHFTASNDRASTSAGDSALTPAPAVAVPDTLPSKAPPQDTFSIALSPLPHAAARGSGQVAAAGKATAISVTLSGAVWGHTYEGAVRQGACDAMGPHVASLIPVSADSVGAGSAASDIPVPIDSLTNKPHVVVFGRGGRGEACAPIPARTAPADTAR